MNPEIWKQLSSGERVDSSDAPQYGGRLDLRRTVVSEPRFERNLQSIAGEFAVLSGLTKLQRIRWRNIDFTGSHLSSLRFHDCELEDCLFDHCTCRDWRMWKTSCKNCSFGSTDLRDSAFGAVDGEVRNSFTDVNFSKADMRGTMYTSAQFSSCVFRSAKLKKVDFQGSVFTDCTFEGELDEVLFYDQGFNGKHLSKNELLRTDFSRAQFRCVEFRRLNLETVRFPEGDEHIPSRKLTAIIGNKQKWLGPKQRRGVLSKREVLSAGGQQGLELILSLLATR